MKLVEDVYAATAVLPKSEEFGLKGQIRRAAYSIPSNIAEGSARSTRKGFLVFLQIASGSLRELDTQLEIALRLEYLTREAHDVLQSDIDSLARMLSGLMTAIAPPRKEPK